MFSKLSCSLLSLDSLQKALRLQTLQASQHTSIIHPELIQGTLHFTHARLVHYLCGDSSYRHIAFYTVQTVYSIPLH